MIKGLTSQKFYALLLTLIIGTIASLTTSCKKDNVNPPSDDSGISIARSADSSLLATATTTSGLTCEQWTNIPGNDVSEIPTTATPNSTTTITNLEETSSTIANYGRRISAYLTAPLTGNYTFWISGDDAAELWLATSDDPSKKVRIANFLSWTNFREWTKFASQKSVSINLNAGKKYYIEVLQKQGGGDGSVSVQWQMPNGTTECPIPGGRFTPYTGSTAAAAQSYTSSGALSYEGKHDFTISGKSISGGTVPAITLKNCYNVHITLCRLTNSSNVGVYLFNCHNITIDYNYFTNVSTGVYVDHSSIGAIAVNYNQFLNMKGPFPRGQFVQFNNVNGPGNSVSYNKGENVLGSSSPEDAINMYQSSGTAASPIKIVGNWIRGGGPSASGGGIMLGDQGGSYLYASDNLLVNPGEYGMAIAGGDHNSIVDNKIYGVAQSFTNVGLYVNSIGGYNETNSTVKGNQVKFYNSNNYSNPCWLAPGVSKPEGWDTSNTWGAASLTVSIIPTVMLSLK